MLQLSFNRGKKHIWFVFTYPWVCPLHRPWNRWGLQSVWGCSCAEWQTQWWWTPWGKRSRTWAPGGCPPPHSSPSPNASGCSWTPTSCHRWRSWFSGGMWCTAIRYTVCEIYCKGTYNSKHTFNLNAFSQNLCIILPPKTQTLMKKNWSMEKKLKCTNISITPTNRLHRIHKILLEPLSPMLWCNVHNPQLCISISTGYFTTTTILLFSMLSTGKSKSNCFLIIIKRLVA